MNNIKIIETNSLSPAKRALHGRHGDTIYRPLRDGKTLTLRINTQERPLSCKPQQLAWSINYGFNGRGLPFFTFGVNE